MSILRTVSNVFKNKSPVPYTSKSGTPELFQNAQKRGGSAVANMEAYGSVGTLFAIVSRLANDTSAVDWKLYRKKTDNRKRYAYEGMDDRVEVTVHPALTVWNKPNQFMTQQELVESFQQHIDLTGEGWLGVTMGERMNVPIELWPMRPDRVAVVTDSINFLTGYIYTGPDGTKVPMSPDEVIQFRMPNPMDPYRGMGPVQSLMVDLDSSRFAAEYNRNFFLNDASPGGMIEFPEMLSDEDFKTILTRWREQHKGVSNAHRMGFIEGGKWVNNSFSMRDMQFAELREVSSQVIQEAFGFPKFKLGKVDDVNRATAEAMEYSYAKSMLRPRLERIKQALNNDFLPLFGTSGEGVEFDYCAPEPDNQEADDASLTARANVVAILVGAGFDASQVLELAQLPNMDYTNRGGAVNEQTVVPDEQGNGPTDGPVSV